MKSLTALAVRLAEQDAAEVPGDRMQSASEGAQAALHRAAQDPAIVAELAMAVLNAGKVAA